MSTVLGDIVANRRSRIVQQGYSLGTEIPKLRPEQCPVVPFSREPFLICEIKKRSPSRGNISANLLPIAQAGLYVEQGVRNLSVLTEEDYFGGNLEYLMQIKLAFPNCAILRKDFLIDEEDIVVSYRAGADAVLLIASILEPAKLCSMYNLCTELGLEALVEVHDKQDIDCTAQAGIQPNLLGINSRDLKKFRVDALAALQLRREFGTDSQTEFVFESGIFVPEQVSLAIKNGFNGVLVGESVVRKPDRIPPLLAAFTQPLHSDGSVFWEKIMKMLRVRRYTRPLVKICGITQRSDAEYACNFGADMLGFVFAESKRRADISLLHEIVDIDIIKIAVVTEAPTNELRQAYREGLIHAFQYHGSENPEECSERGLPYYKALGIKNADDIPRIMEFPSPRVLVDALRAHDLNNSQNISETRRQIDPELVLQAAQQKPLWLAGGITPYNIASIVQKYSPELVDLSSGVEYAAGMKDKGKLREFFAQLDRVANKFSENSGKEEGKK